MKCSAALMAALLLAASTSGTAADLRVLKPLPDIEQRFEGKVPVAGAVVRGLQGDPGERALDLTALTIDIPDHEAGFLCVDLASRDGWFEAHPVYPLTPQDRGLYRLDLPLTRTDEITSKYRARDLAVLAYIASACRRSDPDQIEVKLVPRWGRQPSDQSILILLNSPGADCRVLLPGSSGGERYKRCHKIESPRRMVFNRGCSISLPSGSGLIELTIRCARFGDAAPDVPLLLYLP